MIKPNAALSISRQCALLSVSRSSLKEPIGLSPGLG